ncbi:tRNA-intron lyase [Methanolobus chelungpuianus]|uniref:tRNA-splicing endonuclease n=1 Tax=Methanolobus chelungpuianus TaxID=502115 RepID=A0AAE3H8X3_9EURY|nr:tRNA-intron lyase [Methanolobus chelungpuianus]MCQ6962156.1 ribonuclease BN [Methanolobus chelungpuianus]
MIGRLVKDRVLAAKQAINELYNTGYYGRPKGDTLELTLIEAAYLLYKKKLDIELNGRILGFEEFFTEASKMQQYFELKYIVYKDLRERGFYVQPSVTDFRVYPRGGHPGKTPARSFVYVRSERIPMPLPDLFTSLNAADNVHKQMVLAIVDEESDLTYYEVKKVNVKGAMPAISSQGDLIRATLLEDRVIVWDASSSQHLHLDGFYGKPLDDERLQLSLVESAYLMQRGLISIGSSDTAGFLDIDGFSVVASSIEPDFLRKYKAYANLRDSGLVPKTGFKFGTHFRVYSQVSLTGKMPHSEYLIHAIPWDHVFMLPVMSRAVRLANSVRKRMLYAVEDRDTIAYVDIGRIKM